MRFELHPFPAHNNRLSQFDSSSLRDIGGRCYPFCDLKVTFGALLCALEAIPQDIVACHDENDRIPFDEWLDTLGDKTQAIVMNRIDRLEQGNFGDVKAVGGGVSELRIDYGPGYRVYFGRIGHVVHLIRGGDKSSQDGDIKQAKNFWTDHEDEKDNLL